MESVNQDLERQASGQPRAGAMQAGHGQTAGNLSSPLYRLSAFGMPQAHPE